MDKIECILERPNNSKRFKFIIKNINRITIFFGAGLSLAGINATEWLLPFEQLHKKLMNSLKKTRRIISDPSGRAMYEDVNFFLDKAKKLCEKGDFLSAGDEYKNAFEELRKICSEFDLNAKQILGESFNRLFVDVFAFDYQYIKENVESPYDIRALFLLPFFNCPLITTNIDMSFEEVEKEFCGGSLRSIILPRPGDDDHYWKDAIDNSNSIFYIHGHVNSPEYLVMTGDQYKDMYELGPDGHPHGARLLLEKTVMGRNILFIGASLQKDKTVEIINSVQRGKETPKGLKLLPMLPVNEKNKALHDIALADFDRISYSLVRDKNYRHQEVSLLLLELIRQTQEGQYCDWRKPSSWKAKPPIDASGISDELKDIIIASLSSVDTYDEIYPDGTSILSVIGYLHEQHSIYSNRGRAEKKKKRWSICCIYDDDFTFSKEDSFSPLHNYPIGDTVYVFCTSVRRNGDHTLHKDYAEELRDKIKYWLKNQYPYYPTYQVTMEDNQNGPFVLEPRIRVIIANDLKESQRCKKKREALMDGIIEKLELGEEALTDEQIASLKRDLMEKTLPDLQGLWELSFSELLEWYSELLSMQNYKVLVKRKRSV